MARTSDYKLNGLIEGYVDALSDLDRLTQRVSGYLRDLERIANQDVQPPVLAAPHRTRRIEIRCLGTFSVCLDTLVVPLQPDSRPAALLRLLVERGHLGISRDAVTEALWPGIDPDVASNRLHGTVFGLRRLLEGAECIEVEQGCYRLGADVEVDSVRFEELISEAVRLEQTGDREASADRYRQAVTAYGGDYLGTDSEHATVVHRQYLRDLHLNALVKLARFELSHAAYEACIRYARQIVQLDDCCEEAYQLLMLAHGRLGGRTSARRWYEICERILRQELDLAPSQQTRLARDQAIRGDGPHRSPALGELARLQDTA